MQFAVILKSQSDPVFQMARETLHPACADALDRRLPKWIVQMCSPYTRFIKTLGQISAIDMNEGEILWQVAHGETPDNVRDHPALQGMDIPRTGQPSFVGILITKTLAIAGDGGTYTDKEGRAVALLRLPLSIERKTYDYFLQKYTRAACIRGL